MCISGTECKSNLLICSPLLCSHFELQKELLKMGYKSRLKGKKMSAFGLNAKSETPIAKQHTLESKLDLFLAVNVLLPP